MATADAQTTTASPDAASFRVATQGCLTLPVAQPATSAATRKITASTCIGQIFIDSDADRMGHYNNVVLFRDGIDDYTYLNIDGQNSLMTTTGAATTASTTAAATSPP